MAAASPPSAATAATTNVSTLLIPAAPVSVGEAPESVLLPPEPPEPPEEPPEVGEGTEPVPVMVGIATEEKEDISRPSFTSRFKKSWSKQSPQNAVQMIKG